MMNVDLGVTIGELLSPEYKAPKKLTRAEVAAKAKVFTKVMKSIKKSKPVVIKGRVMWGEVK